MRISLAGSLLPGRRARRARFPTCGVIRVAGYSVGWDCDPTPLISPKEHQKERCDHSRSQRSFITFYGALRNILLSAGFSAMLYMIELEQMFANNLSQKVFLADATSESNRWFHVLRKYDQSSVHQMGQLLAHIQASNDLS